MSVKIKGISKMKNQLKRLKDIDKPIEQRVKRATSDMTIKAKRNAPRDTGLLRRSIKQEYSYNKGQAMGKVWISTSDCNYAIFQEKGTIHMNAQPYFYPSYYVVREEFIKDMETALRDYSKTIL